MSVTERVWKTGEQKYLRLLPERIGVSPRGRSKRLERVLTDFGGEHSFRHASERVMEHYGFEINASAVRNATLHHPLLITPGTRGESASRTSKT